MNPLRLSNLCESIVLATALAAFVLFGASHLSADEIVIDDGGNAVSIGEDVECSTCPKNENLSSAIELLTSDSNGEVTAGQLWKFFNEQGVESVDELTFRLDMDADDVAAQQGISSFDINSLQIQIESPQSKGDLCTDVSIGSNRLLVPKSGTDDGASEMQLAVKLKYDFMKQFTADSTEKVKLNVSSSSPGIFPRISIASGEEVLSGLNILTLLGFVGFWVVVFGVVNWLTKPDEEVLRAMQANPQQSQPVESKKQALSA